MATPSSLAQLRAQFPGAHWPRIDTFSHSESQCVIALYIDADMHWLKGHFPQQPVVAGVVQTHWAGEFAKYLFATGDECVRIDNLKFQQVILPEQAVQLTLDYSATEGGKSVKFRYHHDEMIFSEGKLVFNHATSAAQ